MVVIQLVSVSLLCSVLGQLALKSGMQQIAASSSGSLLKSMATSYRVIGGLMVYGSGVFFWLMALSRADLTYVYPFAGLGYAGIILGSHVFFKEEVSRARLLGVLTIICGVILAGFSAG
jgi:multidrug transporter EmrE-like cation transporter